MPGVGTTRRAGPADVEHLVALIKEFYAIDRHSYADERVKAGLVPLLEDDRFGQVWLIHAADEDEADGYAVVTWSWSLESGGRDCLLDELYLRTRGTGLGGAALAEITAAAADAGARAMFLETEAHNERVRAFYRRNGFVTEQSVWMSRSL